MYHTPARDGRREERSIDQTTTERRPVTRPAGGTGPAEAVATSLARLLFVKIPYVMAGTILLSAVAINLTNVIGRYVFSTALVWAEEVIIFMLIWGVYIAVGSTSYRGAHLTMDLLAARMSSPARGLIGALTVILTVACAAFMVTQTTRILALYLRTGEASMAARVPLVWAHAAVLVGYVSMGVATVIRATSHGKGES